MAVSSKPSQTYHLPASQPRQHSQMPGGWCRQQLPQALGECHFETLCLDQDLTLVRSRYRPNRPLVEEAHSCHEGRLLVITLALQGRSGFCASDGSALAFDAGQTTVTTFPASQGERRYEAASTVSQLRLLVGERLLEKYLGAQRARQLLGHGPLRQLARQTTSAASSGHANALLCPASQDHSGHLERHIHALSLLSLQLQALAPEPTVSRQRLSGADLDQLQRVRDIMLEQMHQPLTLAYLCAAVGLNEFKLKQGLREHYNTTPQRMLLEIRMARAHSLLQSGCQVAQVAYRVGYGYPGNFSAAFTRFYGKSPKSVFGPRR